MSGLGFPITDEYYCSSGSSGSGGRGQSFQGGYLYWNTPQTFTNQYSSVYNRQLRYSSTTKYSTQLANARTSFNSTGKVNLAPATVLNDQVLVIRDVNRSDLSWAGLYTHYSSAQLETLEMNDAKFTGPSDSRIQRVMSHEVGHSVGLAHSCKIALMDTSIYTNTDVSGLTAFDLNQLNILYP